MSYSWVSEPVVTSQEKKREERRFGSMFLSVLFLSLTFATAIYLSNHDPSVSFVYEDTNQWEINIEFLCLFILQMLLTIFGTRAVSNSAEHHVWSNTRSFLSIFGQWSVSMAVLIFSALSYKLPSVRTTERESIPIICMQWLVFMMTTAIISQGGNALSFILHRDWIWRLNLFFLVGAMIVCFFLFQPHVRLPMWEKPIPLAISLFAIWIVHLLLWVLVVSAPDSSVPFLRLCFGVLLAPASFWMLRSMVLQEILFRDLPCFLMGIYVMWTALTASFLPLFPASEEEEAGKKGREEEMGGVGKSLGVPSLLCLVLFTLLVSPPRLP